MNVLIIDGYIDEPSCFGVPPFISPYVRYIYGLCKIFKFDVTYYTIDDVRFSFLNNSKSNTIYPTIKKNNKNFDMLIIVGGLNVPGKYLTTNLINYNEIQYLVSEFNYKHSVLIGPFAENYTLKGADKTKKMNLKFTLKLSTPFFLKKLYDFYCQISDIIPDFNKEKCVLNGTELITKHYYFPNVICEIELYNGCKRKKKCSFCIEQFNNQIDFRTPENIIKEMKELVKYGCYNFRLGNHPDIFGYNLKKDNIPDAQIIKKLFYGIRNEIPEIKILHTDNANPAIISDNLLESKKIIKIIAETTTGGNLLSLGCETFDDTIVEKNNLNSTSEKTLTAIKLINEFGAHRASNGMPQLLPGLNLLFGLIGETKKTWDINYSFLEKILNENLLLRRINIRQSIILPHSYLDKNSNKINNSLKYKFKKTKNDIRHNIDNVMLKKILPLGTTIKNALIEHKDKYVSFSRQLGSYSLIIGIKNIIKPKINNFYDIKVVNYGLRSVTGLILPININKLTYEELKSVYGINAKKANDIILQRPFPDNTQLTDILTQIK